MLDQVFIPTSAMKLFAFQKAKLGENATNSAISKVINISPETISRWKKVNGFAEWLEEEVARYRVPILDLLEQVALDKISDFRYWEVLAQKYGFSVAGVDVFGKPIRLAYNLE